jgi:hypothetical protein
VVEWKTSEQTCKRLGCTVDDVILWSGTDWLSLPTAQAFHGTGWGSQRVYKRQTEKVREWERRIAKVAAPLMVSGRRVL